MGASDTVIRPATAADLPALYRVWQRADGHVVDDGSTAVLPLHAHLVEHGTTLVAERGGEPIGFAAALEADEIVLLSDVFVVPQGEGIGRRLLDALFARHPSPHRYTAASSDPRAVPLYTSFGMTPRGALLYLEWTPTDREAASLRAPRSTRMTDIDDSVIASMCHWFGRDRSADLRYWRSLGAVAVVVDAPAAGAGLVCCSTPWVPEGSATRLGPIASRADDDVAAADTVLSVIATAASLPDRSPTIRLVIGATHPAVGSLQELGFVETDRDAYLASDDTISDLRRHVGAADIW